jgi:hypothetical protein
MSTLRSLGELVVDDFGSLSSSVSGRNITIGRPSTTRGRADGVVRELVSGL